MGALLLLAGSQAGDAVAAAGGRQLQQAEALSRLSGREREQYFAARRELEQRRSSQRLEQLQQAERCVVQARSVAAVERCQSTLMEQGRQARRQQMAALGDLQHRFRLPEWKGGRHGGGRRPDSHRGS